MVCGMMSKEMRAKMHQCGSIMSIMHGAEERTGLLLKVSIGSSTCDVVIMLIHGERNLA